jgi:hypothetical protein
MEVELVTLKVWGVEGEVVVAGQHYDYMNLATSRINKVDKRQDLTTHKKAFSLLQLSSHRVNNSRLTARRAFVGCKAIPLTGKL